MNTRTFTIFLLSMVSSLIMAQTHISFSDIDGWTCNELTPYVGQTVIFDQPVYICNNYGSGLTASMHRQMSPTNQALPQTPEYNSIVSLNKQNTFSLTGLSGYHRQGEALYGMKAKITSKSSVQYMSATATTNTRSDISSCTPGDLVDMAYDEVGDSVITHNLLICAANLEYYLTEQFGTGSSTQGPKDYAAHQKQRAKVKQALSKINADIYGLVEIQQGQGAIAEIAADLTSMTGRQYDYIKDGGSASGTYTKSGYVYCKDVVTPYGDMKNNNNVVQNRKKMQAFTVNATGERFIFSLNHFKAKSGGSNATGQNTDQGDGQGVYNYSRKQESYSVLNAYATNMNYYNDSDVLIMGDLNAYAMEDPITILKDGGMTDLHRYFHADSSYSYTFHGQAGYLDHALCNKTLLRQVTGMAAYHVNSDEQDDYTYDGSKNDGSMFRYSDHDPVLVGLKLGANIKTKITDPSQISAEVKIGGNEITIINGEGGYYIYGTLDGRMIETRKITSSSQQVEFPLHTGLLFINVYANGKVTKKKFLVVGSTIAGESQDVVPTEQEE